MKTPWLTAVLMVMGSVLAMAAAPVRSRLFQATTPDEAVRWQRESRETLFAR